ncbi:hypothetical protein ACX0KM_09460 [Pseudomonas promysalinigenes]|jgi:hypothetical protein|uniref:SSU ribosomal protein S2p (SAe) n=1 Tax=Pseudomonas promysalinigenes TaxID=485898 RepID=A0ABY6APF9_9PSED|nr:hypothetical protein [Pseudomonas promysalinigenes]UXH39533.1 hypothetical protein N5C08_21690 [Pseudomonas promysalinigenes]
MSEARSYINTQAQSYESLKSDTPMNANQRAKFDVLNAHIANTVVFPGELIIVGDPSTPSCTAYEAFLMDKALRIHLDIELNGGGVDGFLLENFELLQNFLAHASIGAGTSSDAWSKHLEAIKKTLQEIELLHQHYLHRGTLAARDEFYAKRTSLFLRLEGQLDSMAAYGAGLRSQGKIKHALDISTKRYLNSGEIKGYAEKISGVARAANWIKKGTYLGVALDVASTELSIRNACLLGREDECRKAQYVERSSLVSSLGLGGIVGYVGGVIGPIACVAMGIPSGGTATVACVVFGGAAGGIAGGEFGELLGERVGEIFYEAAR